MERSILIVEDEPLNLRVFRDVLEHQGYTVITAVEGKEAVDLAVDRNPGLVLMDIGLPGMSGLEATKILKRNAMTRDIPIVALTAYAMKEDEERAIQAGVTGFLSKPIDMKELLEEVARFLP